MEQLCDVCQRTYDPGTRGIEGPFHFLICKLKRDPSGTIIAYGEWRSGVWSKSKRLRLLVDDRPHYLYVMSFIQTEPEVQKDDITKYALVLDPVRTADVLVQRCAWDS
jgi:hypothetical protein